MKIKLEYPYNRKWKCGYLQINRENRRMLILFNSNKERSTCSYARYLMSVKLGRFLKKEEEVDHIDHNKANDHLSNLQILTRAQNNIKEAKKRGKQKVKIKCPNCGEIFCAKKGKTQAIKCFEGKITYCSRLCYKNFEVGRKITIGERRKISKESLLKIFKEH